MQMMLGDRDALEECGKGTAVCFNGGVWERNGSMFQGDVRLDDFGTPSTIRCAMRSIRPSIGIPKKER